MNEEEMSTAFDPEKVRRFDRSGMHGMKQHPHGMYTYSSDYDQLLTFRNAAIDLAVRYGGIDGGHHKAWVIDQMVRALAGDAYERIVASAKDGEDGPETYDWDEGIAP